MAHADGRKCGGQQKQQNFPTGRVIKVVAARLSWTMPCGFFKMEFTSPWTWTLILARTMRFSPHTKDWKLTLVQISERCRLTCHEHDQNGRWHLRLGQFPLLQTQSEELSYPFCSVQCTLVHGLKSFFVAYMGVILSLNWEFSQRCSVSLWIQNFFCTGVNSKTRNGVTA